MKKGEQERKTGGRGRGKDEREGGEAEGKGRREKKRKEKLWRCQNGEERKARGGKAKEGEKGREATVLA